MIDKVIHVTPSLHRDIKQHCRQRGIRMKSWVDLALRSALTGTLPVLKKEIPVSQDDAALPDIYTAPPFWEQRREG